MNVWVFTSKCKLEVCVKACPHKRERVSEWVNLIVMCVCVRMRLGMGMGVYRRSWHGALSNMCTWVFVFVCIGECVSICACAYQCKLG